MKIARDCPCHRTLNFFLSFWCGRYHHEQSLIVSCMPQNVGYITGGTISAALLQPYQLNVLTSTLLTPFVQDIIPHCECFTIYSRILIKSNNKSEKRWLTTKLSPICTCILQYFSPSSNLIDPLQYLNQFGQREWELVQDKREWKWTLIDSDFIYNIYYRSRFHVGHHKNSKI